MEIRAQRTDLIDSLSPLTAALGRNATNPCVEFIAFDADGDRLTATANDLSMSITVTLPATILTSGRICVKGAKLLQALEKFGKDDVCLTAADDAPEARLSCGKAGITIPALPYENFTMPKAPAEGGTVLTLPARTIKSMLQRVQYASGVNDTRVILNGTYLCAGAQGLTAVCCDGFRMAKISDTCPELPGEDVGVIIPRATAAELAKLLPAGEKDKSEKVRILISGPAMGVHILPAEENTTETYFVMPVRLRSA